MIYIITGKTGHGKTAYMVRWARDILRNGGRVYSNIFLNLDAMKLKDIRSGLVDKKEDRDDELCRVLYWNNFSDWSLMSDGTVLCDEGLVYFNARRWESLPPSMQMKFVQHRKDKLDLVLNVQHYTFIDKTLRVLCERFINVELKLGSPKIKKSIIPRIARVSEHELQTLNRCENLGIDPYNPDDKDGSRYNVVPLYQEWFFIRKKIFAWYDTSYQVIESRPEPLRHYERACPDCGKMQVSHI